MADVSRPFMYGAELFDSGSRVVFDKTAAGGTSYIEYVGTGEKIALTRRGRTFDLAMGVITYERHLR